MLKSDQTNPYFSLYFMDDNPLEAIMLRDCRTGSILTNNTFRKMFSIPESNSLPEILVNITANSDEISYLNDRITSPDNTLVEKPVRIVCNGIPYHFYIFHHSRCGIVIIHARNISDFEKLSSQLDDYAQGLVQNIFDLEISSKRLMQSKDRLNRQLKASTELGLTSYETGRNINDIFKKFSEIAALTLNVERCGIWLLEDNWERMRCTDMYQTKETQHISGTSFLCRSYPAFFRTIKTDRLIKADDAFNNPATSEFRDAYLQPNDIKSILLSSIISKGKIIGIVSFEHSVTIRSWEDDESGFAIIFSDHISRILSDAEKHILETQLFQSQKMETIGTLVGGIAHDFNNLLGGIIGSISLLKYKYKGLNEDDEVFKYISIMDNASNRAAYLVKQLLAIARKQDLVMTPVDLNNSINHVIKISKNTFDKSVDINYHLHDKPAVINGDPIQIEQVLLNLCINAYHAMTVMRGENDVQGGTLTIDIKKIQSDELFQQMHPSAHENTYWVITIEDTGIGMTKAVLERIFEPFFTTKKNTSVKGSGLGLSMVYNIVRDHGGFIDIQSEPNEGTVFHVYFPVYEREYIGTNDETERKIVKGDGVILLVDDEEIIRITASKMLQVAGYKVILAENGEDGINTYMKNRDRISAVILDMVMPRKSGREVFFELKKIDPDVKVLLATGYMHDERSEEILKSGVKGFIQKPFSIYELSEAIHRVISN